jgi:hypothetical protein
MYDLFKTLYFYNENQNTKTFNLEILNGLNEILDKKYHLFYSEFNDKLKENTELTKLIEHNTNEYNKTIDKMDEFLDKAERENKVLNSESKNIEYVIPPIFDNRVYARVLPKDWPDQLSRLIKESADKKNRNPKSIE